MTVIYGFLYDKDNTLILDQKKEAVSYPEIRDIVQSHFNTVPGFSIFHLKNYKYYNIEYLWDDTINYEINRYGQFDMSKFKKSFKPDEKTKKTNQELKISLKVKIKLFLSKMFRNMLYAKVDLNKILCCPKCKGDLSKYSKKVDKLACTHCHTEYIIKDKIPYMDINPAPAAAD